MAEETSTKEIKKFKKRRNIYFGILIFFFFLAIILVVLGIKVNFIINDELIIKLSPLDKNIITTYGVPKNITFSFQNYNNFLCKSQCSYSFVDLSNNGQIDNKTLILESKTNLNQTYTISPSLYGAGQEIYLFEVHCHNIKSLTCGTEQQEYFQSSFITLSYDLNELDKNNLITQNNDLNTFQYKLNLNDKRYKQMNYSYYFASANLENSLFVNDSLIINKELNQINTHLSTLVMDSSKIINLWFSNKYEDMNFSLYKSNVLLNDLSLSEEATNARIAIAISQYNNFVDLALDLTNRSAIIDSIITLSQDSNNSLLYTKSISFRNNIRDVSSALKTKYNINKDSYLSTIRSLDTQLISMIYEANSSLTRNETFVNETIFGIKFINLPSNISFESDIITNVSLPKPTCCVFGKCNTCCTTETCQSDSILYPILFIHGHSFNKQSSPEESLNSFSIIQRDLQNEGVINAGQIDLQNIENIPSGEYGKSGAPISVRASYYYIYYYDLAAYQINARKAERIENYAIRLKDIIEVLKQRTGAKKVNIVAHSMGGLVARDYISLFGDGSINKLILVGTPNYGIGGRVKSLCGFFGSDKECEDMTEDSVFLKILNQAQAPKNAKLYTIAGSGCITDNENGDGIVKTNNVALPYAQNYIINGTCIDALKLSFHQDIINPEKYPESYNLIKDILKKD